MEVPYRKPMDSALPHFVFAWVDVSENLRLWANPFGKHTWQIQLTWGQAPSDLPSHWKPTCLHWSHRHIYILRVVCQAPHNSRIKWSDTNFPVLTGANRPGLGSTRFKICIHYSISIDQKQLWKLLVVLVLRCWSWYARQFRNNSPGIGMNIKIFELPRPSNVLKPAIMEKVFQRTWSPIINICFMEVLYTMI